MLDIAFERKAMDGHDVSSAFYRNEDGSWICIDLVTIEHPKGRMQIAPGTTLTPGGLYMGIDVATWLDEQIKKLAPPPTN
jgi:hypothetical protein